MIQGLLPTTPNRLPNPWLYGLGGLASLEAAFGQDNSGLNPGGPTVLTTCSDPAQCPTTDQPVSSTPWGTLPCDPTLVNQGFICNVDASGGVTYTGPDGKTYVAAAFGGTVGPQPVAGSGGGGSQPGNSVPVGVSPTGAGTGTSGTGTGSAAGGPPKPKPANWGLIALLVVGTLVAVKVVG